MNFSTVRFLPEQHPAFPMWTKSPIQIWAKEKRSFISQRLRPWKLKNYVSAITYLGKWNWLPSLLGKPPCIARSGRDHYEFHTKDGLVKLFSKFSFRPVKFTKSNSLLTMFPFLRSNALFGSIDIKLRDVLPYWLASGWYFVFELKREKDEQMSINIGDVA